MTKKQINAMAKADLVQAVCNQYTGNDLEGFKAKVELMTKKALVNFIYQQMKKAEEEKTMKAEQENQVVEEQKAEQAEEKKEEVKRPQVDPELMAEQVAVQIDGAEVIPVKPNGFGVKLGRTRAFAIYRNKANRFRVKTNKVEQALTLLTGTDEEPGYDATIGFKMTADGRDCLLDFNFQEDATVEAFLVDLCRTDMSRKKRAKKAEQAAPEAEQAAPEAEQAEEQDDEVQILDKEKDIIF